ncbi:MAG: hypothetical protein IJ542_01325 [Clostridia bacterium]|nr:hypothetical protein [Clostridia bacterium]
MQLDFHYYATYCSAFLAGYSHKESMEICYSAQLVDCMSKTFLKKIKASPIAATTQLSLEMVDSNKDILELQNITRIWSSFHFLPYDLYANIKAPKPYRDKYRLICNTNSDLLVKTVNLAKKNATLQSTGIAMHVLADTWAHRYFAGVPSLVINNTNSYFYEVTYKDGQEQTRKIKFNNNPFKTDDIENAIYTKSMFQTSENAIMNLGHGRAGHLPDYSFMRYKYMPAWNKYEVIFKDNPSDYYHAFCQMTYALKFLHGDRTSFEKDTYEFDQLKKYENKIKEILEKRQLDSCNDWKAFGESLSGQTIEPFDLGKYEEEYVAATKQAKDDTFLGKFIEAAIAQKSMVTNEIADSKNFLAGRSIDRKKRRAKRLSKLLKKNKKQGVQ